MRENSEVVIIYPDIYLATKMGNIGGFEWIFSQVQRAGKPDFLDVMDVDLLIKIKTEGQYY